MLASRASITTALAVAATLSLIACDSNGEENDYVDSVNEITDVLRKDVSELSKDEKAVGDPQQTADVYEQFAAEFDQAASDAADLDAPEGISELHSQIVKDLQAMSAEASKAADEARAAPAADLVHISARLEIDEGSLAHDIDRTIDEINAELQD
jgi:hypothetical protein